MLSLPLRPTRTFISEQHCVVYVVPQLVLRKQELNDVMDKNGIARSALAYTFCWTLARALSRYHAINAYAIAFANEPNQILTCYLGPMVEEIIRDKSFGATIYAATKTLDIEAGLDLIGPRLTLHITTFPSDALRRLPKSCQFSAELSPLLT